MTGNRSLYLIADRRSRTGPGGIGELQDKQLRGPLQDGECWEIHEAIERLGQGSDFLREAWEAPTLMHFGETTPRTRIEMKVCVRGNFLFAESPYWGKV